MAAVHTPVSMHRRRDNRNWSALAVASSTSSVQLAGHEELRRGQSRLLLPAVSIYSLWPARASMLAWPALDHTMYGPSYLAGGFGADSARRDLDPERELAIDSG